MNYWKYAFGISLLFWGGMLIGLSTFIDSVGFIMVAIGAAIMSQEQ